MPAVFVLSIDRMYPLRLLPFGFLIIIGIRIRFRLGLCCKHPVKEICHKAGNYTLRNNHSYNRFCFHECTLPSFLLLINAL